MKHCDSCECFTDWHMKMCVTCGKRFVTTHPNQLDCSKQCRWRSWQYRRFLAIDLYDADVRAA